MVQVGVALIATLVALAAAGSLISRAFDQRRSHLFAWALTLIGMCAALGAIAVGMLVGFSSALFRAMELGGALVAPLWLATGVVELVTRHVPVRFGARLIVVSYSIVAVVILALDPLRGEFSAALPSPDDHYEWLPLAVIAGSHLIAVATLVACAAGTALRARNMDGEAYDVLVPVALIALAGVLIVSGNRGYLPSTASVIALGVAPGLIWFGAIRTIPVQSEDEYEANYDEVAYGDRPQPQAAGYQAGYPGGYQGGYEDDARARHRRQAGEPPPGRPPGPAPPPPAAGGPPFVEVAPAAMPGGPAGPAVPAGAYGQITVYTLLDGREKAFDQLSREAVQAAQQGEPGTLIYACHEVVGAPTQRIFYQLFRDQMAFEEHQRQPYVRQFLAESRSHVIATNIIELRLDTAKVVPLPQVSEPWAP
jgi:quinol monooxygenase YgiN